MTRFILAAGVAALAITAPVSAERGGNKGGNAAKVERGGGGQAKAERRGGGQSAKAERRGGGQRAEARGERRQQARSARTEVRQERRSEREQVRVAKTDRRGEARVERKAQRIERVANRNDRKELRVQRVANRDDRKDLRTQRRLDRDNLRVQRVERRRDGNVLIARDWDDRDRWDNGRRTGFAGINCPPGLDRKDNGCMPPGQLKKLEGTLLPAAYRERLLPLALRDVYRDDDDYYYRRGDGYVYRVDRRTNLISSLLPLLGGGYSIGQMFPSAYANSYVPSYYRPFYQDSSDDYYRFANGYVYEIDRDSGYIEDIIPLMAGGYGVGHMLPASYSVYNVPYHYRDRYYDNDDYYYRYAPGAIYQVDPTTQLITSIASLLAPNAFAVGQPLPAGYGVYNVPLSYRDTYYDTPDAWYRYNNGHIYQVDPTTQLITAIVRSIV